MTYLRSSRRAKMLTAMGAAADVPLCMSVQRSSRSVVTCRRDALDRSMDRVLEYGICICHAEQTNSTRRVRVHRTVGAPIGGRYARCRS